MQARGPKMESTAVNTSGGRVECEIVSTETGTEDKGFVAMGKE